MGTTMLEKSDPSKCFKTVSAAKCKNDAADNKRKAKDNSKLKRKQRKRSDNSLQSRLDYSRRDGKGPDATEVPVDICTPNLHDLMVSHYEANIKIEESEAQKSLSILQIKELGKVAVKFGLKNVGNESLYPILVKLLKENTTLR